MTYEKIIDSFIAIIGSIMPDSYGTEYRPGRTELQEGIAELPAPERIGFVQYISDKGP